jgi:2-amino-4-hydroxy-6-hydroxymethyldihydropteridine diphosphokinase
MNPSKIIAYLGLGSNLANPLKQLKTARSAIASLAQVEELAFSSFYHSPPMGPQDQPDYVNAVMAIVTDLAPLDLLRCLQNIEQEQGRIRERRWGERTLDLDLLLYDDQQINYPDLIVPHVGLSERAFVLYPLQEIAPNLVIPTLGSIGKLVANCPSAGLKKLA